MATATVPGAAPPAQDRAPHPALRVLELLPDPVPAHVPGHGVHRVPLALCCTSSRSATAWARW